MLLQQREKIRLVFALVDALENFPGTVCLAKSARVMPGRHRGKPGLFCQFKKHPKFHFTIAHCVWIWSDPGLVPVQEIFNDSCPIFTHQVDDPERYRYGFGHRSRIFDVLLPWTISHNVLLVDPVLHVGAFDNETLSVQKERSNAAIHSTGHCDQNAFQRFRHVYKIVRNLFDCNPAHQGPSMDPKNQFAVLWAANLAITASSLMDADRPYRWKAVRPLNALANVTSSAVSRPEPAGNP